MMRMKKIHAAVILLLAAVILTSVLLPSALGQYRYTTPSGGENAYEITFPVMTNGQLAAINNMLDVLNDSTAMGVFQDILQDIGDGGFFGWGGRNYANGNDIEDGNTSNNALVDAFAQTNGYFIVKFDRDEAASDAGATTFTMFSTPSAVASRSGMVTEVFKTTFQKDPVTGTYSSVASIEGTAPATYDNTIRANSYNTDYWAAVLEPSTPYTVNLNHDTDNDPSTNNNPAQTYVAFRATAGKTYQISFDRSCTVAWNTAATNGTYGNSQTVAASGTVTITATADATYYVRIQRDTEAEPVMTMVLQEH